MIGKKSSKDEQMVVNTTIVIAAGTGIKTQHQ